jgi:hypothetical protein
VRFSAPLVIREIGYERWAVVEPFKFTSKTGIVVDVPAGFETDLASVPPWLRSVVSKIGYWSQPAVVHDLLYYNHRNGVDAAITRQQADKVLLEGCRLKENEYNVPLSDRRNELIYTAVRAGGLGTWETADEREDRLDLGDTEYLDQ